MLVVPCSLRAMERLWAPWRMSYIGSPRADGCVFCAQAAQSDEEALIVHRGERCYAVLNLYPYGSGHLMIVPFRHVAAPADLDADERAELWELLTGSLQALEAARRPGSQRRLQPRRGRRSRNRGSPAPARRAALERRRELHAGAGGCARDAAGPLGDARRPRGSVAAFGFPLIQSEPLSIAA